MKNLNKKVENIYSSINQKKIVLVILASDKDYFRAKSIVRGRADIL